MGTITEILAQHEEKKRSALRDRWREYRHLLEQSLCGTLTSDGADRIAELTTELRLTPAEAEAHCQSLAAHAALLSKQSKIDPLKKQIADLDPQIETLSARRAALLAEIDAELQPLLHRSAVMNQDLASLQNAVEWGANREPQKFPPLYSLGFDPPPPLLSAPQPTASQQEESSRREELWDFFVRVRKDLLQGLPRNKGWGHDVQTAVTMVFRYGLEPNSDPLLFVPPGGWPRVEDGYHTDIAKDPRAKEILRIARSAHQPNTEIGDHGEYMLGVGRSIGILDALNMPIAQTDTADEEAAAE